MKKLFSTVLLLITFTITSFAQPQAIPFQGAARNSLGNILSNRAISLRLSILDSSATGPVVYSETHSTTTSLLGLFTVNVGQGVLVSGTFDQIDWGNADKYLSVELDTNNGSAFVQMGITQMLSVPYALHSKTSGTKIGFRANIIPVTVGVGSATPLQLGAIEYNDGNGADSSGFTAPEAGVYQFNVSIFWNPFSACTRVSTYLITGTVALDHQQDYFCDMAVLNSKFSDQLYLQAGQTVKVRIFHNQSAGATIANGLPCIFSGYKVY
ncbi:MAG: hypothetical protein IPP27_15475 [Bacteroidetes bacterium]|nr:hypothetical protein [Bacteroidota bacterium]